MQMTFRWFGENDPVPLEYIKQIPGMKGIVTAVYDVPVGEVWAVEKIKELKETVGKSGLELSVIESVPVHEDIKLGLPSRDTYIENYKQTIRNIAACDIRTVCYNFMPVFDWTRSSLDHRLPDGSTCLTYDEVVINRMNPLSGELSLPGWDTSYEKSEMEALFKQYEGVTEDELWGNLKYFLEAIIPVAEEEDVKMAIHPDDPPWGIFGLPRIMTNRESLNRLINLYDSPYNGLCFCTGSLGPLIENDLASLIREFGSQNRINFIHARNIKMTGERSFEESAHLSECGSVDMYDVINAVSEVGYKGPIRPDHGRMIWGEEGKPGYGLYDRALGAMYLSGIWEAVEKTRHSR
ncbi:mannonate dehydratase [Sutcliffiella horikoshii]|uniref:mannonate dehydratase n=1 Tax=Sutcliffiella horikoshii TaxID=79883 RepID=UPI001CFEB4C3|nr:mannonate dehydratase [Sutcliffiella horikoshii]